MGRVSSLAAASLLASTTAALPRLAIPYIQERQSDNVTSTDIKNITASADIKWVPCYQAENPNAQCTVLTVPLDYEDEDAGTVDIAFARHFVSEDVEDLFYNPGGPGVSGVSYVLHSLAEDAEKWNMNIVTFDPRSVMNSGPKIRCEYGNSTELERAMEMPTDTLREQWDANLAFNTICSNSNKNTKAKYIGSAAVVQDMMHFVELQAALRGKDPKTAQINYYGVSYGTLIGQTLVALYPDRIRRVLIDGNIYGVAHYQGWEPSGIDDLSHGIFMFAQLCFEAGPEWCALAEGMESIEEVEARFDAALEKLQSKPIEGPDGDTMDASTFINNVQQWLYSPSDNEKGYTKIVNETLAIENDDLETLFGSSSKKKRSWIAQRSDDPPEERYLVRIITATDIAGRFPWKSYDDWKAAAMRLKATAKYGAVEYAAGNGLIGQAMDSFVPPPSQFFEGFEFVNTSAPVLFINTAGDPVTPRSSAYNMQRLFNGSRVLIHNSPGHGYGSAPSKCTDDILAAYFADATLPDEGTWCEPDVKADYYFGGPVPTMEEGEDTE